MNLFELPQTRATAGSPSPSSPSWACGCFVRRAVTFFTGVTDTTTRVVWIQSRGLTFDLRLLPGRPRIDSFDSLATLSLEELLLLAEAEGGLARSTFAPSEEPYSGSMQWNDWVRAQLHDNWPEPGVLRRVGDCMTEFAPSGAYVEDWRAQASDGGALIGLVLLSETDVETGRLLHRGGGLVVAGRHAGLVRGRPAPLPPASRLVELVRAGWQDRELLENVFRFEASYATRAASGADYIVASSTLPFRQGRPLMSLDGFSLEADGSVVQRAPDDAGRLIERRFRIDTCEPSEDAPGTSADPSAAAWLETEAGTLLRHAR
jgi:hypothetical protein